MSSSINKGKYGHHEPSLGDGCMLKLGDHRHRADLTFAREEQNDMSTKEQDPYRYTYNWLFNDPWFLAAGLSYESDPIRELDHRTIASTGLGRDIWNSPRRVLSLWAIDLPPAPWTTRSVDSTA